MPRAAPSLILAVGLLLPAAAYAQGGEPLGNCKSLTVQQDEPMTHELIAEAKPDAPAVYKNRLAGNVRIDCDDTQLFADLIEWRDDEQTVAITGHVLFVQPGVRVSADHAIVNRMTHLGTFYEASGYAQISDKPTEKSLFGGMEPDMYFWGDQLVKTGDRTYRLVDGGFTSCVQATPRWDMGGTTGSVTLEKHVLLKNAVLHVKDVPMFYLPVVYYPINKEDRSTGILMPNFGSSTVGGFTLSNAFFWAISRSQDATFFHDWYKKTGQGYGAEYRYVESPGSNGTVTYSVIDEHALTDALGNTTPARKSYTIRGFANQELPDRFRLISSVDYFNDATTQQLYQNNIEDISQRTRSVMATVSGNIDRFQISASFQQNDVYNSGSNSLENAARRGYLPRLSIGYAQKPIGKSRVYLGAAGEVAYLVRQDNLDDPTTNHSLWRLDGAPQVRWPVSTLPWLTVTTQAQWRVTEWFESIDPLTGAQVAAPLTRQLVDFRTNLTGPVFSRVFEPDSGYAEKIKHLIEPSFSFQRTSTFDQLFKVVQNDGTDSIIGGTTTLTYGVTNRLLAKRKGGAAGAVREILRVDIGQSYYSNAAAAIYDPQYASVGVTPPGTFSPIQITVVGTPTPALSTQFRTDIDSKFKVPRSFSATGTYGNPIVQLSGGWQKRQVIPGLPGYDNPAFADHFLNIAATVKRADGRFGGMYSFNYDILRSTWLQRRLIAYYNSQCCGVQLDYSTADISHLGLTNINANRHISISFTLAGVGSFTNPMGSFR
ncbi:MAG TPA: putative LPS assembly protein LptD [Vicinamibacterales bacterium]|nr:putative LPS assembly protein LptD [Vicinamibacterales bacterium]